MHGQLIVASVDNESMLGDIASVPPAIFESTAIISNRLLWLARAGDVIILPRAPSKCLLEYIGNVISVDFSTVAIIVPEQLSLNRGSVTGEVLLSEAVLASVENVMLNSSNTIWEILPYYFTSAIGRFGRAVAKNFQLSQPAFNAEGGAEILNQKTIFRKMAAGINVPIAKGEVVDAACSLRRAVEDLLSVTGTVIVKQDKSGGGEGNYAITSTDSCFFRGVSKFFSLATTALEEIIAVVICELATKGNESLTIEVYYETSQVVYSEYYIGDKGVVDYLNHGIMRMLPLWAGFEIPGKIQPKALSEFVHNSTKLAMLANTLGYVGHLNIDAIITTDNEVVFTEINGRTGGCTHVHSVAQKLLGFNYLNTHQITTYNKSIVGVFENYLDLLVGNGIDFDGGQGRGVVILSSDSHEHGTVLELMFVGADLDEVLELESLARVLADSSRNL